MEISISDYKAGRIFFIAIFLSFLYNKLKQSIHTLNIPIIVFTAVTEVPELHNKLQEKGIQYFIRKPDTKLLLKYIKELLGVFQR